MTRSLLRRFPVFAAAVWFAVLCPWAASAAGLKNATLLIIRHAEKPEGGEGLTPAGEARARAYVNYFQNFQFHGEPVKIDAVFATADSKHSQRPRLTIEPFARAAGLPINQNYKDDDYLALVNDLETHHAGKNVLICWHHGKIAEMLTALGADPNTLIPGGHWPGEQYDWVIVLRFDHEGHIKDAERIEEGLTGR